MFALKDANVVPGILRPLQVLSGTAHIDFSKMHFLAIVHVQMLSPTLLYSRQPRESRW